ncbi:MAG: cyclase family protein [Candidatus Omnitrophica bacterium]|nr:cyclase family protein [Candidatus Omnitrophota bacterium]
MIYRFLSHLLTERSPAYGGGALSLDMVKTGSVSGGDSANIYRFSMGSHWGTHVDAPNHFFEDGRKAAEYPPEFWLFKDPQVIDVTLAPSEILGAGKWLEQIGESRDILLLKSGWTKRRNEELYCKENPGIHPDVGLYLRKKLPNIRAIGIDWISISPFCARPIGRQAHKAFLDPKGENNPVLIIEDMDLSCGLKGISEVSVSPLRVDGADSAPCTVIGGFSD